MSGKSRGFGFVIFENYESIENVLAVNKHFICGKLVDCKMAEDKNKLNESSFRDYQNESMSTTSNLNQSFYNNNFYNQMLSLMNTNKSMNFSLNYNNNSINQDFQRNNDFNFNQGSFQNNFFNYNQGIIPNDMDYSHHYKGLNFKNEECKSSSQIDSEKGKNEISEEINKSQQTYIYNGNSKINTTNQIKINSCSFVNENPKKQFQEQYLKYKKSFLEPFDEFKDTWYMKNYCDQDDVHHNFIRKTNVK